MNILRKKTGTFFLIASIAFIFFTLFIQYLQYNLILDNSFSRSFFNSDAVFFINMSDSLKTGKSVLSDWILTGAPRIFPTLILNLIIITFSENYFTAQIIIGIMQFFLFNILMILLLKFYTDIKFSILSILIIDLFLFFSISIEPFSYLLISSHHFGNYLNFLLSCFLFFRKENNNWFNNIFKWLVIFIASFSNPLFLATFTLPYTISNMIFEKIKFSRLTLKNLLLLLISILGFILGDVFFSHKDCAKCYDNTYQEMTMINFDYIYISLYHIKEFFSSHSNFLQNSCFILSITAPIFYIIYKIRKTGVSNIFSNKKAYFFSFIILSILANIFCFLFLTLNPQFRHLYVLYFSPLFLVPIITYKYIINYVTKNYFNLSISCFMLTTFLLLSKVDTSKKLNFSFYPDDIKFIDQVLDKNNVSHGFISYGSGNRLLFLSRLSLSMIHYHKVKPIHLWIDKKWIDKEPEFIINLDPNDFGFNKFKTISNDNIFIHILK